MKTNIKWKKPFIFLINKIKIGRVQEVGKGSRTKSFNFLHLWLKLIIDKKMGGERLNEKVFIQIAPHGRTSCTSAWGLCFYIYVDDFRI